jgi:phosphoribosyl 1,2-cyclic phosphodiesterase
MRVQILGAHQGESRDTRFMSVLIDGRLALDAGGLTSSLTFDEQLRIEAVLITHRHYDHIKDLPVLAHAQWETRALELYCIADTRDNLRRHIFNDVLWPSLKKEEGGYFPVVFNEVNPGEPFDLLGYRVFPFSVPHTVPSVGYCIESGGKSVLYTADTSGEGHPPWADLRPDLLLVETTMSNRFTEQAARFKHMTPLTLGGELVAFKEKQGYYPRTVCVHINPNHEREIREELAVLSRELNADISAAREGMVIEL